jgi:hypothetical protein
MNKIELIAAYTTALIGSSVSAANVFQIIQPVIGILAGIFTIAGTIVIIRVNSQRRRNLLLENERLRRELKKCK